MSTVENRSRPMYIVNIEGVDHSWSDSTITLRQLRELAGWEPNQQIVEVDLHAMVETTLAEDAVVTLKPGHGFAKKIRFQRG